MKRKTLVLVGIVMTAIFVFSVTATATLMIPTAGKAKENAKADKSLARENADDHRRMPPGLEKIVFIHYRKGFGKPPWAGPPEGKGKEPECYGFLSKGVKWKTLPINYVIHPDLEAIVPGAVFASAETWDAAATSQELFSGYTIDESANWDSETRDGRNEFSFGNYPQSEVIAVAIVWGYFSGPPKTREIVEFDVMFDDTDFTWGHAGPTSENALGYTSVMDLQNIATHEIGHGVGLDDIYHSACSEVTMHGYSVYGETKKRTLELPDITGIQELYGA